MSENKEIKNSEISQIEFELVQRMLNHPDIISETLLRLSPSDFYDDKIRIIYRIINDLVKNNQPVTIVGIQDVIESDPSFAFKNYKLVLLELKKYIIKDGYDGNINFIAKWSQERQLVSLGRELCDPENRKKMADFDQYLESARKKFFDIITPKNIESVHHVNEITDSWLDLFHKRISGSSDVVGIPTSFEMIDSYLGGFQKGDVCILAARPSRGKTTLALNFLLAAAENCKQHDKDVVVFFSLEMTKEDIFTKLVENMSGHSLSYRAVSLLNTDVSSEIEEIARETVSKLPICIDDKGGISVSEIEQKIKRQIAIGENVRFVVIDYLGLIKPSGGFQSGNIQADVANISRDIKLIAKRLNIPILLLVQLNRTIERRTQDKKTIGESGAPIRIKPQLSDLRDSGAIEQDADVVMILTSKADSETNSDEPKTKGTDIVYCDILKNRKGDTGYVTFQFKKNCSQFIEVKNQSSEKSN
ncbi:MAG: AAA family ATPase [Mycoplasmataceae bacterium]|nr:AAA family ATPase [Mycoplasmataceae bacterium]